MPDDNLDGGAVTDPTNTPEIQELIKAAVAKETAGLISKRDELLREAKKAKEEKTTFFNEIGGEEGLARWREWKEKLEKNEELKAMETGDIESLKDKWFKRTNEDFGKQLKAKDDAIGELSAKNKTLENRLHREIISNTVRAAASSIADIMPSAIEYDITAAALATFSLNDEGQIIGRDANGEPIFGKDTKPITIKEWLESLREQRPHWFQAPPSGAGIRGSAGRLSGVDLSKMTPIQRIEYARQHGIR